MVDDLTMAVHADSSRKTNERPLVIPRLIAASALLGSIVATQFAAPWGSAGAMQSDGTPLAVNDTPAALQAGPAIDIAVTANDTMIDNAVLNHAGLDTSGTAGTVAPSATGYSYTPSRDFSGADSFSYQICDDDTPTPSCSTATVTINVQLNTDGDSVPDILDPDDDDDGNLDTTDPDPLTATVRDDPAETIGTSPVTVDILSNDDFLPGANTALTEVAGGTATGTTTFDPATGLMTYTPAAGESGTVTVAYQVCNTSTSVCRTAAVAIDVTPVEVVPVPVVTEGTITGTVFLDSNRGGAPTDHAELTGISVELHDHNGQVIQTSVTASPYTFTGLADGDYTVSINPATLPPGTYGTAPITAPATTADGNTVTRDFSVAYAIMTGTVLASDGSPVPGTRVRVTDSAGNVHDDTTAADGTYRIQGLPQKPLIEGAVSTISRIGDSPVLGQTELIGTIPLVFDIQASDAPPTVGVPVEVEPPPVEPPTVLAFTGFTSTYLFLIAILMLELGAALLAGQRQRRT